MPWFEYPNLRALGKTYRQDKRGGYDVVLISGDAYVDHPSFPAAVICRRLEDLGLKTAVIAQPDWRSTDDFKVFGAPNLFFAVTAGSMDSMVANFTAMKMPRREDRLSPAGKPGLRPKRAVQVYCQRLRESFPETPIVIGGIEASLRRFSHYDFWEDRIRDSILIDSNADLLVYGMAEAVLPSIVEWFAKRNIANRDEIPHFPQTCIRVKPGSWKEFEYPAPLMLPTAQECRDNPEAFLRLSKILDAGVSAMPNMIVQKHPKGDIVCFPFARENWTEETLLISKGKYNRRAHPLYQDPIPGLIPVQFSVISHHGCLGTCTFCALSAHQGRCIRSRTPQSIIDEIRSFTKHPDFKGTVPDIGGASVNMYGWHCLRDSCVGRNCTLPGICSNLSGGLKPLADLLRRAAAVPGVKHVFVGSGLRYDLVRTQDVNEFEYLIENHVSGQLKVAPEHLDKAVLNMMRKGADSDFADFVAKFRESAKKVGKKIFLVPYFMTVFPGSGESDEKIKDFVAQHRLVHEQVQEFTPTPSTLATAMFYAERDLDGNPIKTAKNIIERKAGRTGLHSSARSVRKLRHP